MNAPWPNLPAELWQEIAHHVKDVLDIARFRSVCKLWRSSLPSPDAALTPTPIPSSWHDHTTSCFFKKRTIYRVNSSRGPPFVVLEQTHDNRDGTIINKPRHYQDYHLFHSRRMHAFPKALFNVVDNDRVCLSPVSMYYHTATSNNYNIKTAVVNDVMVALLYGGVTSELAVLSGDPSMQWKTIDSTCKFDDIVEYKGKFFMVDRHGRGFTMDHNTLRPSQIAIHNQKSISETEKKGYRQVMRRKRLVVNVATGDLYLLIPWRGMRVNTMRSPLIQVYMLSNAKGGLEWNEVRNIGSRALVVGSDFSFCSDEAVPAMYPCAQGYTTNCIYFDGYHLFNTNFDKNHIVVYNIRDETFFKGRETSQICSFRVKREIYQRNL